jgi:molybdopterin-guanine dinucleotide biosynthesis protein
VKRRRDQNDVVQRGQDQGQEATHLSDNLEDLVLLEGLSRDVKGKVLRVDDSSDKVEVLGDQVLAVVHDEDSSDVELDVVALLLGLEEVKGSPEGVRVKKNKRSAQVGEKERR